MRQTENQVFETDSMTLVAYMRVQGHEPIGHRWVGRTFKWQFEKSPEVLEAADSFRDPDTMVSVRSYNRMYVRTRQDFFDQQQERN